MKNFKILLILALAIALLFSLAACGGAEEPAEEPVAEEPATEEPATEEPTEEEPTEEEPAAEADGEGFRIAIVTSPNTVDDGSFNEDNYNGILNFIAARGDIDTVNPVQEPTGDITAATQAVADIVADYDIIVTPGFQFGGIASLAEENPDKKFILVDSHPTDADFNTVEVANIYAMTFAEQESGFFAGVAAALETASGKVAVVNGVAYPSNVNYQYGFEAGVAYAVKHLGATAEIVELASYAGTDVTGANVGGNYTGNFGDEAQGKVVGNALIAEGVDIIFVAAGDSGNGVFTAAKEHGATQIIGCDVDQFDDGVNGDTNIILTSALKNMAINVERQLNAIVDGSFAGANVNLYADTDSTGYVSADGRHQLADETLVALESLYPLVQDKSIEPPSNFSESTPEEFPGL